ncbi:hypothetical protein AOC36_05210 [Erysipelothrix larvae]|uniref:Single-stranded DNA-binding protein n=1 Tax=Erysipelothrix larvae TaxID=1514105 RepID=A0A0X8GZP7_9FIRM|nr:hypothetical protein AOC36_05210 [Erysipelothrix larvae]
MKSQTSKVADLQGGIYHAFDIEVIKNFREADFSFKTEIYRIHLWQGMAAEVMSFRKIDDNIAVHGRIEKRGNDLMLIAENLEYLA